jgi:hypothetical protein
MQVLLLLLLLLTVKLLFLVLNLLLTLLLLLLVLLTLLLVLLVHVFLRLWVVARAACCCVSCRCLCGGGLVLLLRVLISTMHSVQHSSGVTRLLLLLCAAPLFGGLGLLLLWCLQHGSCLRWQLGTQQLLAKSCLKVCVQPDDAVDLIVLEDVSTVRGAFADGARGFDAQRLLDALPAGTATHAVQHHWF